MSDRLTFTAFFAGTLSRWRTALVVLLATVVLALALALILPPSYRSATSFVTTDAGLGSLGGRGSGGGGALGALAGSPDLLALANQFGFATGGDGSESPQFYAQLLGSRELLTRLVLSRVPDPRDGGAAQADSAVLLELIGPRTADRERAVEIAIKRLQESMQITYEPRTNWVTVNVDARWPELAAEVANRATALVSAFNKEQRLSRARARRDFLESRVAEAQAELRAQEDSQRLFYERNRSWENSPALLVDERRMRRQVETTNSLYLSLRQQYEMARIDEVNTTPVITVVDRAVPPRERLWPRYGLLLGAAAVLGLGLGVLAAAARELAAAWARDNPEKAAMLRNAVRRSLPRRRPVTDPRVA